MAGKDTNRCCKAQNPRPGRLALLKDIALSRHRWRSADELQAVADGGEVVGVPHMRDTIVEECTIFAQTD